MDVAEKVVEAIVSASVEYVLGMIASFDVVSYFKGKKDSGFDVLHHKLETTFRRLAAVLADLELKQVKNPAVKELLDELKDAVDDAQDLLGEVQYDAFKLKVEAESTTRKRKASQLFSSLPNLFNSTDADRETKVEEILGRLKAFEEQINSLGLEKGVVEEKPLERMPSTSLIEESEFIGRNAEKKAVMSLLTSDNVGSQKICVIAIVGIGGMGKTTLAQALFNDERAEMFERKAWACVSDEFDALRVTKTILEAVTSDACNSTDLNSLQVKLKEKLTGKKFLIVLDDIWDDDYVKWGDLMKPFKDGAQGSKIIVTTRSEKVANSIGTVDPLKLDKLTYEDCWQLFAKHASGGFHGDFTAKSELKRLGQKIVEKCNGLPLAAKALGGLLRSTSDVGKWERIANSDLWEFTDNQSNILPALKLSYYYLPLHLKRCFVYCSIFPKDYEFQKEELVLLWIAEEFVKHSETSRTMEEIGEEYFDDLVSMSFFQQLKTDENTSYFVMHDLMVDLARSISGKYFCLLDQLGNCNESIMKTRHLACVLECKDLDDQSFSYVFQATRLRTFLSLKEQWHSSVSNEVVEILLLKLKCLRVLSFFYFGIRELPESIGELKHLHYLDVSYTNIKMLPESVSTLYNLQILKLYCCQHLETLPKEMHHLINLRYLDIRGCFKLVETPRYISKLKSLQMSSIFIVGKDSGAKMEELRELSGLRGELYIKKLENVGDVKDASEQANLKDKKYLDKLSLQWSFEYSTADPKHERDVLEMLFPIRSLKELNIYAYPGERFPDWVGEDSFAHMVYVELSNASNCSLLPSLGQLPSLKTLIISGFDAVKRVGTEFYGNVRRRKPFSSLEILIFSRMSSWEIWEPVEVEDGGTFGELKELEICNCPKLTESLPTFFPSLTKITIFGCKQFVYSLPRMPRVRELKFSSSENCWLESKYEHEDFKPADARPRHRSFSDPWISIARLETLQIFHCTNFESLEKLEILGCDDSFRSLVLDFFPKLKELSIHDCRSFESLTISNGQCRLTSLSSLTIGRCPEFVSFPEGGLHAPYLTFLDIEKCEKLKRLPEQMHNLTCLTTLRISGLPEMETCTDGSFRSLVLDSFPKLKTLSIYYCRSFESLSVSDGQCRLTSLSSLHIDSCPKFVSFPEGGLHAPYLTFFGIEKCEKLKRLPEQMHNLTCLTTLTISDLPEMETCTEGGLPSSLSELSMYGIDCSFRSLVLDSFPKLKTLSILKCQSFESLSISDGQCRLTSLSSLRIGSCPKFVSFPEGGLHAPYLTSLSIGYCEKLKGLPEKMHNLTYLTTLDISDLPEMETCPEGGLPSSLSELKIAHCPGLVSSRVKWNLVVSNLTHLEIYATGRDRDVESFPEEGLLPATVTRFEISGFSKLRALDKNGLQQLTSLKELRIRFCPDLETIPSEALPASLERFRVDRCPKLQRMPEEGLPSSVRYFFSLECPLLTKMCLPENGEYWSKINHIPDIIIDRRKIRSNP